MNEREEIQQRIDRNDLTIAELGRELVRLKREAWVLSAVCVIAGIALIAGW